MSATPLLLDYTEDVYLQICGQQEDRGEFDPIFACTIETAGFRQDLPAWVYALGQVGCIQIQTPSMQENMRGDWDHCTSLLLFRNEAEYRWAYSVARRLAKATYGNPAAIAPEEWQGFAYAILSPRHELVIVHIEITPAA